VIAFLVVTSIVNLAMGYGLAIYLTRSSASAQYGDSANQLDLAVLNYGQAAASVHGREVNLPVNAVAAGTVNAAPASHAEGEPLAGHVNPAPISEADQEIHTRTTAIEQDLLAGIEEFRNQLAQLKAKGSTPSPTGVAPL
jgi:hypothetical protein